MAYIKYVYYIQFIHIKRIIKYTYFIISILHIFSLHIIYQTIRQYY